MLNTILSIETNSNGMPTLKDRMLNSRIKGPLKVEIKKEFRTTNNRIRK
jgi:hypothetical protein